MTRTTSGRKHLGRSGITVSDLCLGTMTYGTQTDSNDAFAQMDAALDAGVDFWDCAEAYPVNPMTTETAGRSEEIIGDWFAHTGRRSDVVLATKIAGKGGVVRDGAPITAAAISGAVEGSLRRLKTDHIDLYQLHWPNRGGYMFRQNWTFDPSDQNRDETLAHMEETLDALGREVRRGTIRAYGLSNESAWGTAQWLALADRTGAPRAAAIQNEYSLLTRLYDADLAELSANEDIGLMAYSPLAAGQLTGKYLDGAVPDGSRKSLSPELGGRQGPRVDGAVRAYLEIARRHGIAPEHLALAFVRQRPFSTSTIFGATTLAQLQHLLGVIDVTLSDAVQDEIAQAHKAHPMPF